MMRGRGYVGNEVFGNGNCFGFGFMHNGWGTLIVIGILLITTLLIIFLVHNKKTRTSNNAILENLKMKYVLGEITEEEYVQKKTVLSRK